jgi:hypothetical protein
MLFVALITAGCSIDPYILEFAGDGAPRGDARADARVTSSGDAGAGGGEDAADAPPACVAEPERCDGLDNDCDGEIDDGFNLDADPANCGACGEACDDAAANQRGSCVAGDCVYACAPGFIDCGAAPGCEVACIRTNSGEEACDGLDNDCDCQTDEGFSTQTDPDNCGACLRVCIALHATPLCVAGECEVGPCEPGWRDLRDDLNGCEYQCPVFPPAASDTTCDGLDDDCDGAADDDVPGVGAPCATGGQGECAAGRTRCVNGSQSCVAETSAEPEECDGLDNDCDGTVDDGFDKQNDPTHCGPSCAVCEFPNAIAGCAGGQCTIVACEPGWTDASPSAPGCEYACTPSGPEVCDGLDNDCDRLTDAADPDLIQPPANFCASRGECAGVTLACRAPPAGCGDTTVAWRCVYPAGAETNSCGELVAQETLCDGKDNDCDNAPDDAFPLVGQPCDDGRMGVCRGTGVNVCDLSEPDDVRCNITMPGGSASAEVCNGKDDDCDGAVDDGARDAMAHVTVSGNDFWIYQYEASRPDATATSAGSLEARSCSRGGVLPWALVTWDEAAEACDAAGKRLCTEDEWQAACGGSAGTLFPYGDVYDADACNGNDYDPNCAGADDDVVQPTAAPHGCPKPGASQCVSSHGAAAGQRVYDMSGNLREWTAEVIGGDLRRIRGGGFDNVDDALTCEFDFWSQEPDSFFFNLGFRCCADEEDP